MNLPRWYGRNGAPEGREGPGRTLGLLAVAEEAVDGRPGAADVGAEGAELDEMLRERRRREIVRRQGGELARVDRRQDLLATLVEAAFAHRRKTLTNSVALSGVATREQAAAALEAIGRDANVRAEALAPPEFVALASALA